MAAAAGMSECTACPAGTYQDEEAQTACKPCTAGHFCLMGSTSPQLCEPPLSSGPGSHECSFCGEGYFMRNRGGKKVCQTCINGATCPENTTLATITLRGVHWRLSPHSDVISECINGTAGSACRGGASAGEEGQGYCSPGHVGPLCQHCDPASSTVSRYFDEEVGTCIACPDEKPELLVVYLAVTLGALAMLSFLFWHLNRAGTVVHTIRKLEPVVAALRKLVVLMNRLKSRLHNVRLVPKLKVLIVFYQAILSLKGTYAVNMPPGYDSVINAVFPWDYSKLTRSVIPAGATSCLIGGYDERLRLVAGTPLIFCVSLFLLSAAIEAVLQFVRLEQPSLQGMLTMAPAVLFLSSFLCPGVSTEVFSAWSCTQFVVDSDTVPPTTQSYMRDYLNVQCTTTMDSGEEHDRIKRVAIGFVIAWPVFWPLCYFVLLLSCRSAIQMGKHTRLMLSTTFLHEEYEPGCYLWEPLLLLQRLSLTGFVRLLPVSDFERLVLGFLLSVLYLVLLLLLRPFKRRDLGHLAVLAQVVVVGVFFAAMAIKLVSDLGPNAAVLTGIGSTDTLATALLVFVFGVVAVNFLVVITQTAAGPELPEIRLVETDQPPELSIKPGCRWHLFLSHTWSSAQDQCATIKRQLQLILPGVRVFLDIDDLDDKRKLKDYIDRSQCVLLFLSKGYFFSAACETEVAAALEVGIFHLALVHDPERGGASLEVLQEDCKEAWRERLFESGRPIIAWMRVADYQVVSLKQIVAQLLHASPSFDSLAQPPRLYVPGEISRKNLQMHVHTVLAVSAFNPGAAELGNELVAYLKISGDSHNMLTLQQTTVSADASEGRSERSESQGSQSGSGSVHHPQPRRMLPLKVLSKGSGNLRRRSQGGISVLGRVQSHSHSARQQFSTRIAPRFSEGAPAADATHLLLYLSKKTFVGRLGAVLAEEVREARSCGVKVVLAHETDRDRDGVEFDRFFRTTPNDLIADELFAPLATPLATGEHRTVSHAHLLKELGAVAGRRQVIQAPLNHMKKRMTCMCSSSGSSPASSAGQHSPTVPDPALKFATQMSAEL